MTDITPRTPFDLDEIPNGFDGDKLVYNYTSSTVIFKTQSKKAAKALSILHHTGVFLPEYMTVLWKPPSFKVRPNTPTLDELIKGNK